MNYGEELAYWYLRFNGFFPISRYVIHRHQGEQHPSDCDVLAIRPPHVYEPVGGHSDDWDPWLKDQVDFQSLVGVICEVKTGRYNPGELFPPMQVEYCARRLGFLPKADLEDMIAELSGREMVAMRGASIAKLFIATNGRPASNYLYRSIDQVTKFLQDRIRAYSRDKFSDRMFFDSVLLQSIIAQVHAEMHQP